MLLTNANEELLPVGKSTSEALIDGKFPVAVDNCDENLINAGPGVLAVAILTCVQMFVP